MAKSKILIVDDDPKLSHLVATILHRMGGYDVCEENRSFAAVATAQQYRPDLILLDVNMPGIDGSVVAQQLGTHQALAGIPVVFLTSLIGHDEAGLRNGVRYLSKPVEPGLLLSTVHSLCPRFKPEPQAA